MSTLARVVDVDSRITTTLRPVRARLWLAVLLGALTIGCSIALMATSGWLISRASQMPPVLSLGVAIVAVRACGIGRGVFRYLERLVSHDAAFRSLTGVRLRVYDQLERVAPGGLAAFRRGDLLTRDVADVDAMQDLPLRVLLPYGSAALTGAVAVTVAWWLLPLAGVLLLVGLLVGAVLVPWVTVRTGALAERSVAPARGSLGAEVTELLRGSEDLVTLGATSAALDRVRATDADLTSAARGSAAALGIASALGVLTAGTTVVLTLVAGVSAVRDGRLDGVLLAVVVLLPLAAYEAVASLPAAALAWTGVRSSAGRISEVLDTEATVREPAVAEPLALAVQDRGHTLTVHGLTARWPDSSVDALTGIDLDLTPGRRIAVVGPSGAGKSTLIAVLLRFLEHSGDVRLDGVPLHDLAADDVRAVIGLCAQDAHVFDTTIAANLRLAGPEATDDELLAVLERVHLRSWVEALPSGLETAVGEHGGRMSGGQRQRLALARTLLADPPIVLLDEPTEHLDTDTADALTADLLAITSDRTTLLVTHRLFGLEDVDEIVVLAAGRVVERGAHAELMAADGAFAVARRSAG